MLNYTWRTKRKLLICFTFISFKVLIADFLMEIFSHKVCKKQVDTKSKDDQTLGDRISMIYSSDNYSLCIITKTNTNEHKRAANVVLHFHFFVNERRKTIVTRVTVQSRHSWNVRRGRRKKLRKKTRLVCVESVRLISVCSLGMAESLYMMRIGEEKTDRRLVNDWEMFAL